MIRSMGTTSVRDSILLVGASGRTGRYVLRYLCAASVPVIACVRSAYRLASEPSLASAEVVFANVEQPHTLAPLIERAAHVIYLAGGNRRGLSPGAWQVEVDGLSDCLELAKRVRSAGSMDFGGLQRIRSAHCSYLGGDSMARTEACRR